MCTNHPATWFLACVVLRSTTVLLAGVAQKLLTRCYFAAGLQAVKHTILCKAVGKMELKSKHAGRLAVQYSRMLCMYMQCCACYCLHTHLTAATLWKPCCAGHESYAVDLTHALLPTNPALCVLQMSHASLQQHRDAVASGGVCTQRRQHLALWVVLEL
jgi:hypothetical protein